MRVTEIRRSTPTLENAFVNVLREMRGASVYAAISQAFPAAQPAAGRDRR